MESWYDKDSDRTRVHFECDPADMERRQQVIEKVMSEGIGYDESLFPEKIVLIGCWRSRALLDLVNPSERARNIGDIKNMGLIRGVEYPEFQYSGSVITVNPSEDYL
jgi:hypothetical protein